MAVNSIGDGNGVNTVDADDFGLSELTRIGEQYNHVPYSQRELRRRHSQALQQKRAIESRPPLSHTEQEGLDALRALMREIDKQKRDNQIKPGEYNKQRREIQAEIDKIDSPIWAKQLTKAESEITKLTPRLRSYRESTKERLNMQAVNSVNRELSETSINSYVSGSINTQQTQVSGMGLASQSSFEELMGRRSSIMGQIANIRSQSMTTARSLVGGHGVDPEAENALKQNAEKVKELASQLGPIAVAMKTQRELGEDPESRKKHMVHMGQKAQEYVDSEKMRADLFAGRGEFGDISRSDMRKKESEAAHNLVKALDELRNSAGKSKEEIAKLAKSAEEAAERFEEVEEAKRAGAGQDSWMRTYGAAATAVANVSQLVGSYFQTLGISQPMAEMGNISAYAGIENQKYDSYRSALAGNMTERMNLAGWAAAREFGGNRATAAAWKVAANITGGGFGVTAGVLQTADAIAAAPGGATGGKLIGNAEIVQSIAGGIQATGESGLLLASSIMDAKNSITTSQVETAGINTTMDAVRRINQVPGHQLQQYRDHIAGLYMGSVSMGRKGEAFLNNAAGSSYLDMMMRYGLSSEQVASMSQSGALSMGSMFDPNQMVQAKRFENLGFGPAEESMRRMGALAAGGTQNPSQSLEKLLERAVSVGLDSSKSISMIVDSTGAAAEQSAMQGMANLGDQISRIILSAVDRNNPNQEMAAKQAVATFQTGEQARNNRSASWHGMIATSRIQKELGLNWRDAYTLQGFSAAQLQALRGKPDREIIETLFNRGFDGSYSGTFTNDLNASLDTVINSKLTSQAESGAGYAIGTGAGWLKHIRPWIDADPRRAQQLANGDFAGVPLEVNDAIRDLFWSFNASNPGGDPRAMFRDMLSQKYLGTGEDALGSGTLGDLGGSRSALAYEVSGGARQKARAAQQGLTALTGGGSGAAGISAVAATGRAVEGMASESTWAEAAAKSAADFGESAVRLNAASSKLTRAAEVLLEVARVRGLAGMKPSEELPKGLDTVQDKMDYVGSRGK